MGEVKDFLNKPTHETTIGDTLLITAATIVMSELIRMSLQGWLIMAKKLRKG